MLLLADNDVGGAVAALRHVIESAEWLPFAALLDVQFVTFAALGLSRDATDERVWNTCQVRGVVLITGNRASGPGSLDQVIRQQGQVDSLPVVTIGDPQRVVREPAYARLCAISLLDLLDRLDTLHGTERLFIP